jgi:hypothetical protein
VFSDEIKFQKLRENDMKFRHLLAVLALSAAVDSQAALIHQYELNGSLADALGGPALVANGGGIGADGYVFKPNQGLQLRDKLGADYTVDLVFHFDALNSWRKIVDFSDLTDDVGLYAYSGAMTYFGLGGTTGILAPKTDTRLTLSRSADAILRVYQDGKLVASLNDKSHYTDLTNHYLNFFRDDRNGSEAAPGAVDFIHIYDNALSAAEVNRLVHPAPEPASGLLMACGLGLLFMVTPKTTGRRPYRR